MQLSPSARIMDTAEHDDVSVRRFRGELITGRVQHGKAGELPRPCQMQHGPGGHLVELIVQRFTANERQRRRPVRSAKPPSVQP